MLLGTLCTLQATPISVTPYKSLDDFTFVLPAWLQNSFEFSFTYFS